MTGIDASAIVTTARQLTRCPTKFTSGSFRNIQVLLLKPHLIRNIIRHSPRKIKASYSKRATIS